MNVERALRKAFQLGQDYWRQADSESYRQNALSYETQAEFDSLVEQMTAEPCEHSHANTIGCPECGEEFKQ